MQAIFLDSTQIDKLLGWPLGKAEKLARRRRLPHVRLPDGSIRFRWAEIEALLTHVPADEREAASNV